MEKTGTKNLTFKEKAENFWYHYKWHTLIAVFFLIVAIMIVSSVMDKDEPDVLLYYGGPAYFSDGAIGSIEDAFQQVMTEDANGDGKKMAQLIVTTVLSSDQVATKVMDAREEGDIIFMGDLTAANNEYNQEILYGQGIICILDEAHYEESKDRFQRFDAIVSKELVPKNTFADGKGVYLKDTAFGKYFEVFDGLPDDTVLCIKIKPLHIEKEKYDAAVDLLSAALRFDLERPVSETKSK